MIDQRTEYIPNNPVNELIVGNPEDYIYSSARDYGRINGLVDVEISK